MADPITLGLLHLAPAAFSAGRAYIKHKQEEEAARKARVETYFDEARARLESEQAARQKHANGLRRANQIFDVLTDIGVMLFRLEVVDRAKAKAAWKEIDDLISVKGTFLGLAFEAAKKQKRYGLSHLSPSGSKERTVQLIAGLAFCAACFPMPIYWGYGCGTFNDPYWTAHMDYKGAFDRMDNNIMALKTSGLPGKVLLKQPIGVDKETPCFDFSDLTERSKSVLKMLYGCQDRDGYDRPKDPNIVPIQKWGHPEAWWSWWMDDELYKNGNRYGTGQLTYQYDPGRVLFAWVNWNRADLAPGEALCLYQPHIRALAMWLEGLPNITFKVLRGKELDGTHVKYPEELKVIFGDVHDSDEVIICAVRDPKFYSSGMSAPSKRRP